MEGEKLERDEELDVLVAEVQRGSEDLHQSQSENHLLREQIQLLQERLIQLEWSNLHSATLNQRRLERPHQGQQAKMICL